MYCLLQQQPSRDGWLLSALYPALQKQSQCCRIELCPPAVLPLYSLTANILGAVKDDSSLAREVPEQARLAYRARKFVGNV